MKVYLISKHKFLVALTFQEVPRIREREVAIYFSAKLPQDKIIEFQHLTYKTSNLDHTK
jgi:hypothetical protein